VALHARKRPRRRGDLWRAAALLSAAGVAAAMTFPAAAASRAVPRPAVRLPATAEVLSPYLPQVSCDPAPKPGVSAFRALMLATYSRGSDGGISRSCSDGGQSEHKEGRAWDWMLDLHNSADHAAGTAALTFLLAPGPHGEVAWNARRLGIMYIIWNRHIWASYRASEGWRAYTGPNPHTDHIHFSFAWAGAMKHTSWWTGRVAVVDYGPCQIRASVLAPRYSSVNVRPCPAFGSAAAGAYSAPGSTGFRVMAVQRALHVSPVTGVYGAITARAVATFQHRHPPLAATGVVDLATAVALKLVPPAARPAVAVSPTATYAAPGARGEAVAQLQRVLRVRPVSGIFGSVTLAAVKSYQHRAHLPVTGIVTMAQATALHIPGIPPLVKAVALPPYAKPGDRGSKVVALQRALRVRPVSGFYGPVTARAVLNYQRAHRGLHHSGTVDLATAKAMRLVR